MNCQLWFLGLRHHLIKIPDRYHLQTTDRLTTSAKDTTYFYGGSLGDQVGVHKLKEDVLVLLTDERLLNVNFETIYPCLGKPFEVIIGRGEFTFRPFLLLLCAFLSSSVTDRTAIACAAGCGSSPYFSFS